MSIMRRGQRSSLISRKSDWIAIGKTASGHYYGHRWQTLYEHYHTSGKYVSQISKNRDMVDG